MTLEELGRIMLLSIVGGAAGGLAVLAIIAVVMGG